MMESVSCQGDGAGSSDRLVRQYLFFRSRGREVKGGGRRKMERGSRQSDGEKERERERGGGGGEA